MTVKELINELLNLDMDDDIYILYGRKETGQTQYTIDEVIADSDGEHLISTGYSVER